MKFGKKIAAACNIIGLLLLAIVVIMCIPLAVPRLFGFQTYAIVSGSMEPEIPVGSIVYAKKAEPTAVTPGDVIVFYGGHDSAAVVTHRVVENRVFHLPGIGKYLPVLTGIQGKIYMICIIVAGVLLRIAGKLLSEE